MGLGTWAWSWGGCRHLRVEPIGDALDLAEIRAPGEVASAGWWADVAPATRASADPLPLELPAPRIADPTRLTDLLRVMLESDGCSEVIVSVASAQDRRLLHGLRQRTSAVQAMLAGLSHGVHYAGADGRSTHRLFPDEMASVGRFASELTALDQWLGDLAQAALRVSVAVLGARLPSRALLRAVQRARIGAPVSWRPLSEDQAAAITSGPLDALECPLDPADGDRCAAQDSSQVLPREWVPARAAALALELPIPGADGIPGIPVEAGRPRPISQSMVTAEGDALLGEAHGPQGVVPVRMSDSDLPHASTGPAPRDGVPVARFASCGRAREVPVE